MAKNVIMMIGDGMGWEMSRAGAIQAEIEAEIAQIREENPDITNEEIAAHFDGRTLDDYYTEGQGFGTSYQDLEGYAISTTGNTYIAGDKSNSALEGDPFNHNTGESEIREGFEFNPEAAVVEGFDPNLRDGSEAPILETFDPGFDEDPISQENGGVEVDPAEGVDPGEVEGNEGVLAETVEGEESEEDPIDANLEGGNVPIFDLESGGETPWDADYYENRGDTSEGFDREYIKNLYPDSAGTATGLYSGVKTYVGAISVDIYEEAVETAAEEALDNGKAVGVVSSVPFNHATPAAAVAHVNQRNKYNEQSFDEREGDGDGSNDNEVDEFGHPIEDSDNIFYQIVNETQPTVVLGGGHYLTGEGTEEDPNERYITQAETENLRNGEYDYTFVERGPNASEELAETAAEIDPNEGDRLFGIYGARGQGGNLPWRTADDDYSRAGQDSSVNEETGLVEIDERLLEDGETDEQFIEREIDENPTLAEMTSASLDVLGDDEDGFWLMIEGGDIDWSAHANDMDAHLGTLKDFDESVEVVEDWVEDNGGWSENLLIVTADHDHYLTLNDDFPELLADELLLGEGGETLTTADVAEAGHFWGSDETVKNGWATHTSRPVPVYYQGADSELIAEFEGSGYEAYGTEVEGVGTYIDQVHLGNVQITAVAEDVNEDTDGDGGETDGEEAANFEPLFGTDDINVIEVEGSRNLIFAGDNNDLIDLTGANGNNRSYGGNGDDTYILGEGDRLFGDAGDDCEASRRHRFFATSGGGNTINGNEGADQFWIADASLPESANIINDFTSSEDVIGIAGLDIGYDDLSITDGDGGAIIAVSGSELAILSNADADFIANPDNFVFA